jgi:membrane protease subunit (stomatin/prohibitin family)
MTVQSVSLPEELQKVMDQKIGMGMVGDDLAKFMQYQAAQAMTGFAQGGGMAGEAMGLGAGVALGQVMAQKLTAGLPAAPAATEKPKDVMATLEKLAELASKGVLTAVEFEAKKTELLKKLV